MGNSRHFDFTAILRGIYFIFTFPAAYVNFSMAFLESLEKLSEILEQGKNCSSVFLSSLLVSLLYLIMLVQ